MENSEHLSAASPLLVRPMTPWETCCTGMPETASASALQCMRQLSAY